MLGLLIDGLLVGLIYALTGMGLVVIYKATGVLNFAHGVMGAMVALVTHQALVGAGVPYLVALAIAVTGGALLGLLVFQVVIRPLRARPVLSVIVSTIALWLVLRGIAIGVYGSQLKAFPPILEGALSLGGVSIGYQQLISGIIAVTVIGGLFVFFQRTRLGISVRAVYENPLAAKLMGIRISGVSATVWGISGALAGLGAVLLSPTYRLGVNVLDQILIAGFIAVIIGGLNSFVGAAVGGLVLGVVQNFAGAYLSSVFKSSTIFLLLLLVLAVRPQGMFGQADLTEDAGELKRLGTGAARSRAWAIAVARIIDRRAVRRIASAGVVLLAVSAPLVLTGSALLTLGVAAVTVPAVLSLTLLTGESGEISLGQAGFMAVGAYSTAILYSSTGLPSGLIIAASVLAATLVGAVVALPSLRLSGLQFAVATLGFGWAIPEILLNTGTITGGYSGLSIPADSVFFMPIGFGQSAGVYWASLVFLGLGAGALWLIRSSALGRKIRATRDSAPGAVALGIRPATYRVITVALSAGLAGLAGSGYSYIVGYVAPQGFSFTHSVFLVVAVVVGGTTTIMGAVVGASIITVVPYLASGVPTLPAVILGAALYLTILLLPSGVAGIGDAVRAMRGKTTGDALPTSENVARREVLQ